MVKIKYFSVYSDFKTSFFSKLFFFLSFVFLLVFVILSLIGLFFQTTSEGLIGYLVSLSQSSVGDISLALVILCAGLGGIALFFHHQFKKLARIADEIEELRQSEDNN